MGANHNPETCEAAMDSLWSLQYMTGPGILCAFAGKLRPSDSAADGCLASHAAHFRFTDFQVVFPYLLEISVWEVRAWLCSLASAILLVGRIFNFACVAWSRRYRLQVQQCRRLQLHSNSTHSIWRQWQRKSALFAAISLIIPLKLLFPEIWKACFEEGLNGTPALNMSLSSR